MASMVNLHRGYYCTTYEEVKRVVAREEKWAENCRKPTETLMNR